jgi:hypothetical protein
MTPQLVLVTSLLLGAFVVAAGAYGVLYGLGRARESRGLLRAATIAYGALCAVAVTIMVIAPLGMGWKVLIGASALVYYAIPPVTWRHLNRIHRDHGANA